MNSIDGGAAGLFNVNSIPKDKITSHKSALYATQTKYFSRLQQLACDGINYYWSRNISHPTGKSILINNEKYGVFVKTKQSSSNAMPKMKLTFITNVDPNDPMFRSSNWMLSRKTAYMTGYLKFDTGWSFYSYNYSDKTFRETIAHETGHAIVETYSGFIDSITHHGSSTVNQDPKSNTTYPRTGEIDLMKYANEDLSRIPTWDTKMVADSKDVTGLLFISGISKK